MKGHEGVMKGLNIDTTWCQSGGVPFGQWRARVR